VLLVVLGLRSSLTAQSYTDNELLEQIMYGVFDTSQQVQFLEVSQASTAANTNDMYHELFTHRGILNGINSNLASANTKADAAATARNLMNSRLLALMGDSTWIRAYTNQTQFAVTEMQADVAEIKDTVTADGDIAHIKQVLLWLVGLVLVFFTKQIFTAAS